MERRSDVEFVTRLLVSNVDDTQSVRVQVVKLPSGPTASLVSAE
jgi:hypothetical protein